MTSTRTPRSPFKTILLILAIGSIMLPMPAFSHLSNMGGETPDNTAIGACRRSAGSSPHFENRLETEHFVLQWTNKSHHSADNISDPALIKETAGYLETAWEKFATLFVRKPYLPPGSSKILVIFKDLECYAFADPPEGPIELNSSIWVHMPSIRQTTTAHELFHKLQYAYGYKTRWPPRDPVQWFTEGTASWAEVFVWGRVSRDCKMEDLFKSPELDFYEAEDMALPFWIYFVSGNRETPRNELMAKLMEKYEEKGDAKEALFAVIRDTYGPVQKFLNRFASERRKGFWQDPTSDGVPYVCILGPNGKDLVAEIKNYQNSKEDCSLKAAKGKK